MSGRTRVRRRSIPRSDLTIQTYKSRPVFAYIPAMPSTDVHQHLWPEGFVAELSRRTAPPRLYRSAGEWTLRLHGEPAQRFELATHDPAARSAALEDEGLERALVCLSCPLGIESLPREESAPLLDAFHDGVRELGAPFGLWGALPLLEPDPADVDEALDAGAVGVSIPAGALATPPRPRARGAAAARAQARGAPLLVHPGPAPWRPMPGTEPAAPSWWPALTGYVTQMHEAWFALTAWGRAAHPRLRVVWRDARRRRAAARRAPRRPRRPRRAGPARLLRHLVLRPARDRRDGARRSASSRSSTGPTGR